MPWESFYFHFTPGVPGIQYSLFNLTMTLTRTKPCKSVYVYMNITEYCVLITEFHLSYYMTGNLNLQRWWNTLQVDMRWNVTSWTPESPDSFFSCFHISKRTFLWFRCMSFFKKVRDVFWALVAVSPDICLTLVMANTLAHARTDDQQSLASVAMQKYLIGNKMKSFLGFRATVGSSWALCVISEVEAWSKWETPCQGNVAWSEQRGDD